MHTRYRWLSVAPLGRAQLAKVASAMQAKPYSREAKSGYSLSTIRGDWFEAPIPSGMEYVERVTDPLGGELSISRVEFRRTEFRIGVVYPQLELRDPARQVLAALKSHWRFLGFSRRRHAHFCLAAALGEGADVAGGGSSGFDHPFDEV